MTSFPPRHRVARPAALTLLMAFGLTLAGCGGESSDANRSSTTPTVTVRVNTPELIAQESAENYDDNVNGLITGRTLKRWISDWERNRPAGITGKLVILQQTRGPAGYEFIKPDNRNVFTYLENGWREARFNGVTEIAGIVLSGPSIDRLIRKYGIDVERDLIVCAQGTGGNASMDQGRCWYTFRYWGVDAKNLAVLDGGNNHLSGDWSASDFTAVAFSEAVPNQPSPIINKQVSSVKDLPVDNTILQATLEDVINVLPVRDENVLDDGVFLWDGRSREQYSAGETSEAGTPLANRYSSFQNGGSRQSHQRGALQLNWTNLIDLSTGRYKSKAELRAYLNGELDADGRGFVDGSYQPVGVGRAYQPGDTVYLWCETSARAAVSTITTAVILGLPTRLYDAANIEWNSLTGGILDRNGVEVLPADSPWRTDVLSAPYFPNQQANIAPRNAWSDPENPAATSAPRIIDPYGTSTDRVIREDKAYKAPPASGGGNGGGSDAGSGSGSGSGGSGSGPVLPPNPCGG